MSKTFTVSGNSYQFPQQGDAPGWGEEVTDWAEAVTTVLANSVGPGDILQTAANISNNQSSAANVLGLSFDPNVVRGAVVEYSVYRNTTGVGATERVEVGTMHIAYKTVANSYELVVTGAGSSGVTFSITSGGQVQYTSDNQSGSSYSGVMKFRARALVI